MSESYHTSRMREICTSGSQEGRGETVIGPVCLSIRPPRLLDFKIPSLAFFESFCGHWKPVTPQLLD